jgi:ubiquinone/menaquinone biosynthesis C-methylase UbiE
MNLPAMPYFDILFKKFQDGEEKYITAFGKHVHWGYWPDLNNVSIGPDAYVRAQEALSNRVIEGSQVKDKMKVLDAGCGFGGTISVMNDEFSNVHLTGLNIDSRQLDRARSLVKARSSNSVEFIEGDACHLPFQDGEYDAVTAVECIFHFSSRLRFLKEAHRVLKPGGWLSISDFVLPGIHLPFLALCIVFVQRRITKIHGNSTAAFTLTLYKILGRLAGFRRVELEDITKNTIPTYDSLRSLNSPSSSSDTDIEKANRPIEIASKLGLVRYMLVRFQK